MALFVFVLMTMLALSPAGARQTSPDDNHLIVPGQRIGPVKLGTFRCDLSDLSAWLRIVDVTRIVDMSEPSKTGKVGIMWFSQDSTPAEPTTAFVITIVDECKDRSAQDTARLLQIDILYDHAFATADGLHIGASEKQVRGVLGEPNREVRFNLHTRALMYSSGIYFVVSDSGGEYKVTDIAVRAPNCVEDEPCG